MTEGTVIIAMFTIPGAPVPKERARRGANGHWYTPEKTRVAEEKVVVCVKQAMPGLQVDEASTFRLDLVFYLPPYPGRRLPPDIDNLLKLILDALNNLVYRDDRQVLEVNMRKKLNSDDPRTVVAVFKIMEVTA